MLPPAHDVEFWKNHVSSADDPFPSAVNQLFKGKLWEGTPSIAELRKFWDHNVDPEESTEPAAYVLVADSNASERDSDSPTIDHGSDGLDPPDEVDPGAPLQTNLPPDRLLRDYARTVFSTQYLWVDNSIKNIVLQVADRTDLTSSSSNAVRLLVQVYSTLPCASLQSAFEDEEVKQRYAALQGLLEQSTFSENDAMAALHVVASFLFDGGKGDWEKWLCVACTYCRSVIERFSSSIEALRTVNKRSRFVIQVTMWYDVLASVSTLRQPRLLETIRALYAPDSSNIEFSMMSIMGCENTVLWALAETSALAAWKEANGSLSTELVTKGEKISRHLSAQPADKQRTVLGSTAYLFHASARIFIASVVSGDRISDPGLEASVKNFGDYIVSHVQLNWKRLVPSTVFGFFICGCFTLDGSHRDLISEYLDRYNDRGNCISAKQLLKEIWSSCSDSEPIRWQKKLHEAKLLLV